MSKSHKVLFVSPTAGRDPVSGDITYTEQLLANPPEDVDYVTYEQAVKGGLLIDRASRKNLAQEPLVSSINALINVGRRHSFLFAEPFRFFKVRPGVFDAIHMHVFNANFVGLDCPLIISSGAPLCDVYSDRRGQSPLMVQLADSIDRSLARALQVNCFSHLMPQAERIIVYTDYFKKHLVERNYAQADRIDVIPIFVDIPRPIKQVRQPRRIGFVANDFKEKGGGTLLAAYQLVREQHPDCELIVVGSKPLMSDSERTEKRITWLGRIDRNMLLNEILPSIDVFAYPTPHDCFSFVLIEALASGRAIAASNYTSMPEALNYGEAGLLSPVGDAEKLSQNIKLLLDQNNNQRFGEAARSHFEAHFSKEVVVPQIEKTYKLAIERYRSRRGSRAAGKDAGSRPAAELN